MRTTLSSVLAIACLPFVCIGLGLLVAAWFVLPGGYPDDTP